MPLTITLPDKIEEKLQRRAKAQQLSIEEFVRDILVDALEDDPFPTLEEVVTKIRSTPPNSQSIRPAVGSLAETLRSLPDDPDFDLATWKREWAEIEAEMKAVTRANEIAEGRG
jgi:plasmid stability protein